jgi:prefoldin subunit 5
MKNILVLMVACLALYGGYSLWQQKQIKPSTTSELAGNEPAPQPSPTSVAAPAVKPKESLPATTASSTPPVPAAPTKRLAPEGIYYVIQPFSVTTDDGVMAVKVGTGVRLVQETGDAMKVTDGKKEFVAKRQQLSNDLDLVTKVHAAYAQSVAAGGENSSSPQQAAIASTVGQLPSESADAARAAAEQRIRENAEAIRAAAEQRAQRIAEIRSQIAAEEAKKSVRPLPPYTTLQKHINNQNEKIRQLQLELGKLGVAGASLERR